ncbi:light-regulated signal transduction histidine kinase (bacteriophytochrome)/CheY-like chemotaxis protein [Pararhizobium capsulatum DSM 1112]|uniref:histidine kinase n=2 Tax=Pararhizobium capsulatum TaxID=34014 RepID=A0ABU0BMF0_9HYPH|nr:HWE histidine kinase domain-containing protein [Pararhizobium capsulatum]MDQ0318861.1 light-regulated signal transduction histidine kinase (bacteriophytochrome)/CheY-like chemotaxis protein [Pararhizobium capsulatum DSM 1112]
MTQPYTVDLTNCDREPIHIPGSIQPHGVLLAFDTNLSVLLRHSSNAADMLGVSVANEMASDVLLGGALVHTLRNAVATMTDARRPVLIFNETLTSGKAFDISVHRHRSNVIVEFEPARSEIESPLRLTRSLIGRISSIENTDTLFQQAARLIRGMLGYDRVMIYQFERDGSGKVISEMKRADLESFLGQYFPATDIPQQARTLYLRNTIRVIADSSYKSVPLEPVVDLSGEPLDLSFSHLRSVSPIHCEYLRNMGVSASMSISIIIDGELWGLIACHHYSPRTMPMALRVAAEMFGEFFSLHLHALRQKRKLDTAARARSYLDGMLRLGSTGDVGEFLRDNMLDLGQLLPNDGFGLYIDGRWHAHGATPSPAEIPPLARFVTSISEGRIWATHSLSRHFPEAENYYQLAAGLLAIPLSQLPRDYLFFFRKELVQTLNWAGNPSKSYESGPLGDRLTPRKSFAIWKESVHRQAQPWTDEEREVAEASRASLVEVVLRHNEIMAEERAKADVRQRMLNEELNHRVKNILAVIKSLVGQPIHEGRSLKDYVGSLKGRIQALSFAHDQVIRGDGGGALVDLLNAELTPYRGNGATIAFDGPGISLDTRAFSVMALVLHELATNAAKYGSLSTAGAELSISWQISSSGDCIINWHESGGPIVNPPERTGFGTALLDRSIPYDLGGESDVDYAREGLRARFLLPAKHVRVTPDALASRVGLTAETQNRHAALLPNESLILLLEDQMLIAMDVESMLSDRGFANVIVTNSMNEALLIMRSQTPDAAILDINLGKDTSIPVAEELTRRGIPFVFATGYGESSIIPESLNSAPVVRKPYEIETVLDALSTAIAGKQG